MLQAARAEFRQVLRLRDRDARALARPGGRSQSTRDIMIAGGSEAAIADGYRRISAR